MTDRRTFLKGSIAALSVGILAGCGAASGSTAASTASSVAAGAPDVTEIGAPAFPFTWKKLDKAEVEARVWDSFSTKGGCAISVFDGILGLMADKFGYPYNQIPVQMFYNGHKGYTASSLCGSIGGAAGILGLFLPTADVDAQLKELQAWYAAAELPIAQKPEMPVVTSVANSINCIDSVGKWLTLQGVEFGSPERAARCGGVSVDVALKTIDLLDAYYGMSDAPVDGGNEIECGENQYLGTAKGNQGDVTVRVTMDGDKIAKVEVVKHNETPGIGDNAIAALDGKFNGMSSAAEIDGVDVISKATDTSNAVKEAIKAALAQANG